MLDEDKMDKNRLAEAMLHPINTLYVNQEEVLNKVMPGLKLEKHPDFTSNLIDEMRHLTWENIKKFCAIFLLDEAKCQALDIRNRLSPYVTLSMRLSNLSTLRILLYFDLAGLFIKPLQYGREQIERVLSEQGISREKEYVDIQSLMNTIVKRRWKNLLKYRVFQICKALQPLNLSALETLAIVDSSMEEMEEIPHHWKWDVIVAVKHFKGKN